MKVTAARKRKNDPEGVRSRILDATARLFQAQGYHATGMRRVMQVTGLSSGALHHHFATKDALALAVIKERVAPVVRETWVDPVRTAGSLGTTVQVVFSEIVRGIEQRKAVAGCPLNNLAMELSFSNPQLREPLRAIFQEWQTTLAARIGATHGGVPMDRAQRMEAASFVISVYSGAMNLAKTAQSALPLRAAARHLKEWLLEQGFSP